MNDDAIAPVIAVMLLLAIGVTFFSVYTTTYLPALKEQAEVAHLSGVEAGFLKFSSDIDNAAYMRTGGTLSEQIPLGGGDIVINSLKSSGMVQIQSGNVPYLIIRNASGQEYQMYMVNFSYSPSGNFWVDQGYTWQYGYVNVTKGTRSTPLQYCTIEEASDEAVKFIDTQSDGTTITFNTVSFTEGGKNFSSGNGIAKISLNATGSDPICYNSTTGFSFLVYASSPVNATLCRYLSNKMTDMGMSAGYPTPNGEYFEISVTNPVHITINELQIALETQ